MQQARDPYGAVLRHLHWCDWSRARSRWLGRDEPGPGMAVDPMDLDDVRRALLSVTWSLNSSVVSLAPTSVSSPSSCPRPAALSSSRAWPGSCARRARTSATAHALKTSGQVFASSSTFPARAQSVGAMVNPAKQTITKSFCRSSGHRADRHGLQRAALEFASPISVLIQSPTGMGWLCLGHSVLHD